MTNASPTNESAHAKTSLFQKFFGAGVIYFVVSLLTWPFAGAVWLGELPVLALWHLPKLLVADWLRKGFVMECIKWMGVSSGSFSPDYIAARPYALAITYLVPLIIIGALYRHRRRLNETPRSRWAVAFFVVAILDALFMLYFGKTRHLSLY